MNEALYKDVLSAMDAVTDWECDRTLYEVIDWHIENSKVPSFFADRFKVRTEVFDELHRRRNAKLMAENEMTETQSRFWSFGFSLCVATNQRFLVDRDKDAFIIYDKVTKRKCKVAVISCD